MKPHLKTLVISILTSLSDKNLCQDVLSSLEKIGMHLGYELVIQLGIQALTNANPIFRVEFLRFLSTK